MWPTAPNGLPFGVQHGATLLMADIGDPIFLCPDLHDSAHDAIT